MKNWTIKVFRKLFPHSMNVHFPLKNDIVTWVYSLSHNKILFSLLKESMHRDHIKGKYNYEMPINKIAEVALHFYSEDSIDRFIEHLKQVKLNLQLMEAAKILQAGGTMKFTTETELPAGIENVTMYKCYIEFSMPNSTPNVQASVATDDDSNTNP